MLNFVGMAGLKLTSQRVYDSANISDIVEGIEYIHEQNPSRILIGAGSSLGAGLMANYFAYAGDKNPLTAGVGVNSHYNPYTVSKQWTDHYFGLYDYVLGMGMKLIAGPAIL